MIRNGFLIIMTPRLKLPIGPKVVPFRDYLTVEARKLEHRYPHALKVEYRGS